MSKPEILFLQRACVSCGIYANPLYGSWSNAVGGGKERVAEQPSRYRAELGTFDASSERNNASLMPPAKAKVRGTLRVAVRYGIKVCIISGTRSYADKTALYANVPLESPAVRYGKGNNRV